jgi:AAA family ATP:ADP antiporter
MTRLGRLVRRSVDVREGEMAALIWSSAYFLLILTSYYILRPIRDEMGRIGGTRNLAWLFTGTLIGMLLIHPVFTSLVTRFPRRRFIPFIYRFFILNLLIFFAIFRAASEPQLVWVGRVFFIWVSVFNLFVVSVFWSFMTDIYRPDQSKRLFGMLAVGGTVGAIIGASITAGFVSTFGAVNLLLVSALFLELACRAAGGLARQEERLAGAAMLDAVEPRSEAPAVAAAGPPAAATRGDEVIGGRVLDGIRHVLASPYLLGIAALMLFFTISSTFLYVQQVKIADQAFGTDSAASIQFFASVEFWVNTITLVTQLFITGRLIKWLGVGAGLAYLPLISVLGFGILALAPSLTAVIVFQVLRRAGNFAIQRPSREMLYTVLARTDKYKSKNFNDTFVYRAGDQVGVWSERLLTVIGLGIAGTAATMVPFSVAWLGLAVWLGMRFKAIHSRTRESPGVAR